MELQKSSTLGTYLKSLRDTKALSLREVEGRTGISNAFLSQIESGKVKQPSPIVLYKLAELYGVPYEALMKRTGYPVPTSQESAPRSTQAAFHRIGEITEEEEQELLDYLNFLRSRAKRDTHKK